MQKREVYIVSASRTPIGSFGGMLAQFSATELGGISIKNTIEKISLDAALIDEVVFGNVLSANLGQAPARQAAMKAALHANVICTTVNKVCASGSKAIMYGAQSIMLGHANVIIAGGMESMSNTPFYIPKARFGYKYGSGTLIDGIENDGLKDVYNKCAMGVFADKTAEKYLITRDQQDEFALNSYKKAAFATENRLFEKEIGIIEIQQKDGSLKALSEDEEYKSVDFNKIPGLRAVFKKDGTVTAANASTMNDGAAALVLVSGEKLKELGL